MVFLRLHQHRAQRRVDRLHLGKFRLAHRFEIGKLGLERLIDQRRIRQLRLHRVAHHLVRRPEHPAGATHPAQPTGKLIENIAALFKIDRHLRRLGGLAGRRFGLCTLGLSGLRRGLGAFGLIRSAPRFGLGGFKRRLQRLALHRQRLDPRLKLNHPVFLCGKRVLCLAEGRAVAFAARRLCARRRLQPLKTAPDAIHRGADPAFKVTDLTHRPLSLVRTVVAGPVCFFAPPVPNPPHESPFARSFHEFIQ